MAISTSPIVKTVAQSSNTNGVTTSSIDTTGADLLIVACSWYAGGGTANVTISDSKSNTWTGLTRYDDSGSGGNQVCRIFYAKNATVGSGHTFTAGGTATYASVSVSAWSGSDLTAPANVENGTWAASSVTVQAGSITPTAGDLIIALEGHTNSAGGLMTINSSFTLLDTVDRVSNGLPVAAAYFVPATGSAVNPTWTAPNALNLTAAIASFKAATGGGASLRGRFTPGNLSGLGSGGLTLQDRLA